MFNLEFTEEDYIKGYIKSRNVWNYLKLFYTVILIYNNNKLT